MIPYATVQSLPTAKLKLCSRRQEGRLRRSLVTLSSSRRPNLSPLFSPLKEKELGREVQDGLLKRSLPFEMADRFLMQLVTRFSSTSHKKIFFNPSMTTISFRAGQIMAKEMVSLGSTKLLYETRPGRFPGITTACMNMNKPSLHCTPESARLHAGAYL